MKQAPQMSRLLDWVSVRVPGSTLSCYTATCEHFQGGTGIQVDASTVLQADMDPSRQLLLLLEFSDMLRISLAGNLKDYEVVNAAGELVCGDKVFYGAYPAAYAESPLETVNYAACHDNETLFDQVRLTGTPHSAGYAISYAICSVPHLKQKHVSNTSSAKLLKAPHQASTNPLDMTVQIIMKAAAEEDIETRVRRCWLASALVAFSQGVAFFHAGDEILRSKSLDRDSYNSGKSLQQYAYQRRLPHMEWSH